MAAIRLATGAFLFSASEFAAQNRIASLGTRAAAQTFSPACPPQAGILLHRAAPAFGRNLPAAFRFAKPQSSLLSKNWMLPYMQIIHSAGLLPCAAPAKTEGCRRLCCMLRWNSRAEACSLAPCPGESLWSISIFCKAAGQVPPCRHAGLPYCVLLTVYPRSFCKIASSAGQNTYCGISAGKIQRISSCSSFCGSPWVMDTWNSVKCTVMSG